MTRCAGSVKHNNLRVFEALWVVYYVVYDDSEQVRDMLPLGVGQKRLCLFNLLRHLLDAVNELLVVLDFQHLCG